MYTIEANHRYSALRHLIATVNDQRSAEAVRQALDVMDGMQQCQSTVK